MAGLALKFPGYTSGKSLGRVEDYSFIPAVQDDLKGWWNIGLDAARSRKNWAAGGLDATSVGAPAWNSNGYARFDALNSFLQSSVTETNDITVMVVARSLDTLADNAHRPAYLGNYQGPSQADPGITSGGILWWSTAADTVRLQGYRRAVDGSSTNAGNSTNLSVDLSEWACYFGVISGLDINLYDMTNETDNTFTHTLPRFPCALPIRIGSAYATAGGHCDLAHAAIWTSALSEGQLDSVYDQVAAYQLSRYGREI